MACYFRQAPSSKFVNPQYTGVYPLAHTICWGLYSAKYSALQSKALCEAKPLKEQTTLCCAATYTLAHALAHTHLHVKPDATVWAQPGDRKKNVAGPEKDVAPDPARDILALAARD
jgi:hypothetical protein